jgi:hypothetical protein
LINKNIFQFNQSRSIIYKMAFSLAGANVPALDGDWFNPGLSARMAGNEQAPEPFPVLNVRNNSATPTARGNTVNLFMDSASEEIEFAASIVSVCVDRTVYAIQCTKAPASIGTDCGPGGQQVSFNSPPISTSLTQY